MLTIHQLSKRFGQHTVLDDLDFQADTNGVYLIVGTNGCGKTTFMNILANMLKADTGRVYCHQHTLGSKAYKESLFYIPSDFYLPEYLTGQEYLEMMLQHYPNANDDFAETLLDIFDLDNDRHHLLETYSFGMKKKIQLIAAIASGTDYVLADELFSGLDFDTVLIVQELLAHLQQERCFIIVSHDLNTLVAFPDHIYIMNKGKLKLFKDHVSHINDHIRETREVREKIRTINQYFISPKLIR